MRARYFRYLFENQEEGLVHSGCIYNSVEENTINYIYMVGSECRKTTLRRKKEITEETDSMPETVDILIVGAYTVKYIRKLLSIVKGHWVKTIILPYLAPIQRLVLVDEINGSEDKNREAIHFLQDPYQFLKNIGIENIYFLYGNGNAIGREPEELDWGVHFELADADTLQLIREMEGYSIPVVRAGYIVENDWLFYFGVYGIDIQIISNFTRDYFSHLENIDEVSSNLNEDYMNQMKNLIQEYLKKFSTFSATTIVMFEGPLNASPQENDSFMAEKEFEKKECLKAWMKLHGDQACACSIRCLYDKDYDTMQHHKNKEEDAPCFGILMLGNVNLNRYLSEIVTRFWKIRFRVRGVGIPNSGNNEEWNYQILNFSSLKNRVYWICSKHEITSSGVVNDIVLSSANNRFLIVKKDRGVCFSGYLIPKDDVEI